MMIDDIIARITRTERRIADIEGAFVYATVTAASPLRIRLDGDTVALPFTPAAAKQARGVGIGDRVLCIQNAGRLVVIAAVSPGPIPWVRAAKATTQSIEINSWTVIQWDAAPAADPYGMYSTADKTLLTVKVPGVYAFSAAITFQYPTETGGGNRYIMLRKNEGSISEGGGVGTNQISRIHASTHIDLAVGDTLSVAAYQNSAQAIAVEAAISAAWLGPNT